MKLKFRDSVIDFSPEFYKHSGFLSKLKEDTDVSDDHVVDLTQFDSSAGKLMYALTQFLNMEEIDRDEDECEQTIIQYDASEVLQTIELGNYLDIEDVFWRLKWYLNSLLTHISLYYLNYGNDPLIFCRRIFGYKDQSLALSDEELESIQSISENKDCRDVLNFRFAKSSYIPSYDVAKYLYNELDRENFIVFQKLHSEIYGYFTEHERKLRMDKNYCLSEASSEVDIRKFRDMQNTRPLSSALDSGNVNLLLILAKKNNKNIDTYLFKVLKSLKKEHKAKVLFLMKNAKLFPNFWDNVLGFIRNETNSVDDDVKDLIFEYVTKRLSSE